MQHGRVVRGHLLRRYKRFLADVLVGDGPPSTDVLAAAASTTVHCPNTGPMIGLLDRFGTCANLTLAPCAAGQCTIADG